MTPPNLKDFGLSRDHSLQRESTIRRNRDLEVKEAEVDQSHRIWKKEPSSTSKDGLQQKPSRRGLHRIRKFNSDPSHTHTTSPMEKGRQGIQPRAPLESTCIKYPEDFPQRDIIQRTHENNQRVKFQQEVQNYERKRIQDNRKSSYYLSYREEMEPE
ncbi:hypothetical protein O181_023515 [Austropuccinia psidii MF-1]|uniref:Uncharacterized protein n=1 Tax=Austropuccinia psidii MF-1 TaxID=1389203 RepID=A0A9Q3CIN3_9BASI|nr:hypothetical protein [Austropuccinia psidii MF-1]